MMTITDAEILEINAMIRKRDAGAFARMCADKASGSAAEWTCIFVVVGIMLAAIFGAGYAVGRVSALREARAAAVVAAARGDGLAMLTGAVALCANGGDAVKAARFVRGAAAKGGAK